MFYAPAIAIFIALAFYKFYRRLTRISIADVRGPPPESFILGINTTSYQKFPIDLLTLLI